MSDTKKKIEKARLNVQNIFLISGHIFVQLEIEGRCDEVKFLFLTFRRDRYELHVSHETRKQS